MSQKNVTLPITVEHIEIPGYMRRMRHGSQKLELHTPESEFFFKPVDSKPNGPFDPWELREEFLKWPSEDWQGFIAMAGCFVLLRASQRMFEQWQRVLRLAMVRPAREWGDLEAECGISASRSLLWKPLPIQFDWRADVPTARVLATNSLDAIIATIKVDKLQGGEFRVCARFDCKNPPFKVEARQKIFCSSDCAHLVAVRNSRSRAAEAKSKSTKKAPNK